MKLFWKASSLGLFVCGLLFAGAIFTGCYSSPIDPVFSDTPTPPVMTGSPVTGYTAAEVPRFHVGDTVIVTLSGLPKKLSHTRNPSRKTAPSPCPISVMFKLRAKLRASFKTKSITSMCRNCTAISPSPWFPEIASTTSPVKSRQPGRQLYAGQMTVTKAITTAGDFTDFANHKKVWLIRANGQRIKVNCNKAIQDSSQDPLVYPNDQIQVPRRIF
jgi:hypothetical protein